MGADGHVRIYDFAKLEEKYDEEVVESFLGLFLSGQFYKQELNGKNYLTRYHGDNYNSTDMYDCVLDSYDLKTNTFNKNSWGYDSYSGDYFMKLGKVQRECFVEMINFMETNCKITEWEVWT